MQLIFSSHAISLCSAKDWRLPADTPSYLKTDFLSPIYIYPEGHAPKPKPELTTNERSQSVLFDNDLNEESDIELDIVMEDVN